MVIGVDPRAFRFALTKIEDGRVFEAFALDFLSKSLGYDFVPSGGIRDRGIDGLEHTFNPKGYDRTIYQTSIEKDSRGKIRDTLEKLKSNKIRYEQLVYVTNIPVTSQDKLIDELVEQFRKPIRIFDQQWFANHVNDSEATVRAYHIFIESYLHEFINPGSTYIAANLENDPRVYAFLRQQWEEHRGDLGLDEILVDTLILYALEGTDPVKGILRTRQEILDRIVDLVVPHLRFGQVK